MSATKANQRSAILASSFFLVLVTLISGISVFSAFGQTLTVEMIQSTRIESSNMASFVWAASDYDQLDQVNFILTSDPSMDIQKGRIIATIEDIEQYQKLPNQRSESFIEILDIPQDCTTCWIWVQVVLKDQSTVSSVRPVYLVFSEIPNDQQALPENLELEFSEGLEYLFKRIDSGSFMPGISKEKYDRYLDLDPNVFLSAEKAINVDSKVYTFSQPYYIGVYELTNKEWQAVVNPSSDYDAIAKPDHPMNHFTEEELQHFLKTINAYLDTTNQEYTVRLPTEMEWEYAALGENPSRYDYTWKIIDESDTKKLYFDTFVTNYSPYDVKTYANLYGVGTMPVGSYLESSAGFYDMVGNVKEVCTLMESSQSMYPKQQLNGEKYVGKGAAYSGTLASGSIFFRHPIFILDSDSIGIRLVAKPK
ncbi:MAG: SUMF1/EgtB/PvdO family nonheme iron enzyme [Bdellovibrionales bacterium]|nr:SUMF1/EgtB/PvdO family nonheme iron enzyme [Bdellovibrionales bacterium]